MPRSTHGFKSFRPDCEAIEVGLSITEALRRSDHFKDYEGLVSYRFKPLLDEPLSKLKGKKVGVLAAVLWDGLSLKFQPVSEDNIFFTEEQLRAIKYTTKRIEGQSSVGNFYAMCKK